MEEQQILLINFSHKAIEQNFKLFNSNPSFLAFLHYINKFQSKMTDDSMECQHFEIKQRFCMRCGIYYDKSMNVHGIKSHYLNRQGLYSHDIIDTLRKNEFDLSRNKDYSSLSQNILNTFTQIDLICRQIQAGFSTRILACYIFWHSIKDHKSFTKKDLYLSILIAFKYQEGQITRIKNLQVKQRIIHIIYATGQISQKELIFEEMQILQKINFKLKLVTFVDFLEFYVVSGVMFSNQHKRNSDYQQVINFIDSQIQRFMVKGLFFSQPNQQYLALKILYHARQKCLGIDQIWNWHIENVTKTKKEMIDKLINERKVFSRLRQNSLKRLQQSPVLKAKNQPFHNEFRQKSSSMTSKHNPSTKRFMLDQNNQDKVSKFQLLFAQKSKLKTSEHKITRA